MSGDIFYTTSDIAKQVSVSKRTITRWASKNNVKFIGEGVRKIYQFTEEDLKKFLSRAKAGRPRIVNEI